VVYLLIATLYPFEVSQDASHSFVNSITHPLKPFGLADFVLNILLFAPFGALVHSLCERPRRGGLSVLSATVAGAVLSISIELLQMWLTRLPSVHDVIANTLGAGAGAVLARRYLAQCSRVAIACFQRIEGSRSLLCLAFILAAVPLVLSVMQRLAPFSIWDSGFSLQIGNEATDNRPWRGNIAWVGLFNHALSPDEVAGHFSHRGLGGNTEGRNAIALYVFNEKSGPAVRDISRAKPPLDLRFEPRGHVSWLEFGRGVQIHKPAILRSIHPTTKLIEAFQATHEFSVEVWMTPENTTQSGPARIVSFSRDTGARNFTLGQQGRKIEFRVRTPASGLNGTPLALRSQTDLIAGKEVHLVATYKDGVEKLFINGAQEPRTLDLTRDGIIGLGTRSTAMGRIAYSFLYTFPAALLLALYFRDGAARGLGGLIVPAAMAMGVALGTELFQAIAFNRTIDIWLMVIATIAAVLGGLAGHSLLAAHSPTPDALEKLRCSVPVI
jgi:glycopeptide antibiotics resistance protein